MNLTLSLSAAEEAKLLAQARAQGVTPEDLVRLAIEPIIASVDNLSLTKKPTKSALGALARWGIRVRFVLRPSRRRKAA